MSKVVVKLNRDGVGQLLKGTETREMLEMYAHEIAERAGDGYNYEVKQMPTRTIASVYTENEKAFSDNLKNNTLLKVLH